jgi:hypothetical protein
MGCLLWLAIFVAVLAVLAVLFGGFQRGTNTGGNATAPSGSGARYSARVMKVL